METNCHILRIAIVFVPGSTVCVACCLCVKWAEVLLPCVGVFVER